MSIPLKIWSVLFLTRQRGGPSLHKFDDANINRFFRKLMDFYKPMSHGFSSVDIGKDGSRSPEAENYTLIGRQLIDYLLKSTDVRKINIRSCFRGYIIVLKFVHGRT